MVMFMAQIWYRSNNMTEKQTSPTEHDTFFQRAANIVKAHPYTTGAGVVITAAAVAAAGQAGQRQANVEAATASQVAEREANEAYTNSIALAIEASYDSKAVIGDTITIEQGGDLIGPAIVNLKAELSEATYNEVEPLIYDTLELSANLQGIVQPGDRFNVVETDINPEADDGNEYIVVKENKIIHSDITQIPSPETH